MAVMTMMDNLIQSRENNDYVLVSSLTFLMPLLLLVTQSQSYWANYTIMALETMPGTALQAIFQTVNNMWLIMAYHLVQKL